MSQLELLWKYFKPLVIAYLIATAVLGLSLIYAKSLWFIAGGTLALILNVLILNALRLLKKAKATRAANFKKSAMNWVEYQMEVYAEAVQDQAQLPYTHIKLLWLHKAIWYAIKLGATPTEVWKLLHDVSYKDFLPATCNTSLDLQNAANEAHTSTIVEMVDSIMHVTILTQRPHVLLEKEFQVFLERVFVFIGVGCSFDEIYLIVAKTLQGRSAQKLRRDLSLEFNLQQFERFGKSFLEYRIGSAIFPALKA